MEILTSPVIMWGTSASWTLSRRGRRLGRGGEGSSTLTTGRPPGWPETGSPTCLRFAFAVDVFGAGGSAEGVSGTMVVEAGASEAWERVTRAPESTSMASGAAEMMGEAVEVGITLDRVTRALEPISTTSVMIRRYPAHYQ
jgi:hypothetical protein